MEQVKYLTKLFHIKQLPDWSHSTYGEIKNSEILLIALAVFVLFNAAGYLYPVSVLIFGLALPIYCMIRGADIAAYFLVLSCMLWVRLWYPYL